MVLLTSSCGKNSINLKDIPYDYNAKISGSLFCDAGDVILVLAMRPYRDNDFFSQRTYLYEYDKKTGKAEFFCKDATCLHANDYNDCPSVNVYGHFELADGFIRAFRQRIDLNATPEMIDAGLLNTSYLCELRNGKFTDVAGPFSHQSGGFTYRNGGLYAVTPDLSLVYFPNGNYNKPEVIAEDFISGWFVIIDGYLYGSSVSNGYFRFDVNKPENIEYLYEIYGVEKSYDIISPSASFSLSAYDGEHFYFNRLGHGIYRAPNVGNELTLVLEHNQNNLNITRITTDDEYLYYCEREQDLKGNMRQWSDSIYRFKKDLSAPPELVCRFEVPQALTCLYAPPGMDILFLLVNDQIYFGPGGEILVQRLYTVNKDGSDFKEIELPSLF